MFMTLVLIIHVIVCVALILIILLQTGKGADIGAVFGGGSSQTLFGSTGATPFLSKVTIVAAVVFMVTSTILTYFSGRSGVTESSLVAGQSGPSAPISAPVSPGTEPAKTEGAASQPAAPATAPSETPAKTESPAAPAAPAPVPAEKLAAPSAEKPAGSQ